MKSLLIAASTAVLLAGPALAQTQTTTPSAPATGPRSTQIPPSSAAPQSTDPAAQTGTPATAPAAPTNPRDLIASEFPTYDKDSNGALSKSEFATWIGTLKAKTDTTPTPAAEMTKYTDGAFATADKDQSKTVTLAELQSYLVPGA